jgi:hypothetical protein
MWKVKEKSNEARNTLEEHDRERERETGRDEQNLYGLLGITQRNNQSQFVQSPKKSTTL